MCAHSVTNPLPYEYYMLTLGIEPMTLAAINLHSEILYYLAKKPLHQGPLFNIVQGNLQIPILNLWDSTAADIIRKSLIPEYYCNFLMCESHPHHSCLLLHVLLTVK